MDGGLNWLKILSVGGLWCQWLWIFGFWYRRARLL